MKINVDMNRLILVERRVMCNGRAIGSTTILVLLCGAGQGKKLNVFRVAATTE
jgi:hypothetical protein